MAPALSVGRHPLGSALPADMTVVIRASMKTAVSIPDPIFKEADDLAARLGLSHSELYARALKRYLATRRHSKVTEALNAIYAREKSAGIDDALTAMQAASVPREDW